MIAKYNGKYYCAMNYGPKMNIWRYPVEKLDPKEGHVLPNENLVVNRDDIEEIFYGIFQVVWNDKKCAATMPIDHSFINLVLGEQDAEFAKLHQFTLDGDDDCWIYVKDVSVDEITEFIFTKTVLTPTTDCSKSLMPYTSESSTTKMDKDEWIALYHELDYKPYWTD